jgi:hypothetical protein
MQLNIKPGSPFPKLLLQSINPEIVLILSHPLFLHLNKFRLSFEQLRLMNSRENQAHRMTRPDDMTEPDLSEQLKRQLGFARPVVSIKAVSRMSRDGRTRWE